MSKLHAFLSIASVFVITTTATAQQCQNGICRVNPSANNGYSNNRYTPTARPTLFNPLAALWPGNTNRQMQRPILPTAACVNGNCPLGTQCADCDCKGGYCTCGPNCRPHYQSRTTQPYAGSTNPSLPAVQRVPAARQQNLRATAPRTNSYEPVSYLPVLNWETDMQRATKVSRQTGRPILVKVTADWCGYCKQMKAETFTDAGIITDVNASFVAVELNADTNRELIKRLGVKSLPTVLVISPDQKILEKEEGFRSAAQLSQLLRAYRFRAQLDTDRRVAIR